MSDDYAEITASIVTTTDDAWLIDDGAKETWVPRSLVDPHNVELDCRGKNGKDIYTIPIKEWFAKKEGLI